jgi:hypothetical protein
MRFPGIFSGVLVFWVPSKFYQILGDLHMTLKFTPDVS